MAAFTIAQGNDTFVLDTAGNATVNGQAGATWTTDRANNIVVTGANGATTAVPATWQFNDRNHLTVMANSGQEMPFDFGSDPQLRNSYTTVDAVLNAMPHKAAPFTFALRGEWSLDANHNLLFSINGVQSVIDGFVSDPIGRFIYHFADKDSPLRTSALGFAGSWDVPRGAAGEPLKSGDAKLVFQYQKEDGSAGTFELPGSATIDSTTNQLAYTYSKANKNVSIDFRGTLMIDPDFQIAYIFNRQTSAAGGEMVGSTTIAFDAMLTKPDFSGDLQLSLKKYDGSPGTALKIGGNFTGTLGPTKLLVGFGFQQSFGASGTVSRTAAFDGELTFSGGEIQWSFKATGQTVNLALGVDVKLGAVSVDSRLNLQMDNGQVSGVTFLLGVSF